MISKSTTLSILALVLWITLMAVPSQASCAGKSRNCPTNASFNESTCSCQCNAGYTPGYNTCNRSNRSLRRLGGDGDKQGKASVTTPTRVDETTWDAVKAKCGEVQYQISVYVEGHIGLVAEPIHGDTSSSFAASEACAASLFIHHGLTGKEIWTVDTSKKSGTIDRQSMYTLTTFSLSDLARAYDEVQLRGDMGPNSSISTNVVQLNCADFVTDLAKVLNIQVTRDVTVFVARRLLKHSTSSSLLQEIRDNMGSFDNLAASTGNMSPPPDESTSDRDLVEYLVETRTGKLY